MTGRAALRFALIASASAGLVAACNSPAPTCVARGGQFPYSGTASWLGQADVQLVGARLASVVVDDFSTDCSYDGMEFVASAAGCRVWVHLDSAGRGNASASVEPGQTCTIALADESVSLAPDTGTLTFVGGDLHIVLDGPIRRNGDAGVAAGRLQWTFDGR